MSWWRVERRAVQGEEPLDLSHRHDFGPDDVRLRHRVQNLSISVPLQSGNETRRDLDLTVGPDGFEAFEGSTSGRVAGLGALGDAFVDDGGSGSEQTERVGELFVERLNDA